MPMGEAPGWLPNGSLPTEGHSDLLLEMGDTEVKDQLKRVPNDSSPGPDRLPYAFWKTLPKRVDLLKKVFNLCIINGRVPKAWKKSLVTLVYKKGDKKDPANFRPISLQPAIYKLYTAILARRLAEFCIENGTISPLQKGFMPIEGTFEHSFLMSSLLEDCKRKCRNLRIVWLDFRDAFGSVPRPVMFSMMEKLGIPTGFIQVCKEMYTGAECQVKSSEGLTRPIPSRNGVKQGCPLSPILFNLTLQGLLTGLQGLPGGYQLSENVRLQYLAYADDLCVIGTTREEISTYLQRLGEFLEWSGMTVNIGKCAALSVINEGPRKYVESFSPSLQGSDIRALKWGERYRYLGVEIGRRRSTSLQEVRDSIIRDTSTICGSLLTDWQKVDAINTFVISQATYYLRAASPSLGWARQLDNGVRALVKRGVNLPKRTISEFFYLKRKYGGLGLFSIEDNLELASLSQTLRCLNSPDAVVRDVARTQLREVVRRRTERADPSPTECATFMNNRADTARERRVRDVHSLWTEVRRHTAKAQIEYEEQSEEWILRGGPEVTFNTRNKKKINSFIRSLHEEKHLEELNRATDQGRSFPLISKSAASNGWIGGKYVSFADYRFAIKARLNLLPVKTVLRRMGKSTQDTRCPKCTSASDTLAHRLNSCPSAVGLMRERHNTILERTRRAINVPEGGTLLIDQKVPRSGNQLRPDIQLSNGQKLVLVDVTVPFETGPEAFTKAREEKRTKYADLAREMRAHYEEVIHDALVVGSLGSWDPLNDVVLRQLRIGQNYAKLYRQLCCLDAIHHSRSIWIH